MPVNSGNRRGNPRHTNQTSNFLSVAFGPDELVTLRVKRAEPRMLIAKSKAVTVILRGQQTVTVQ
jgi:hypothetical protein